MLNPVGFFTRLRERSFRNRIILAASLAVIIGFIAGFFAVPAPQNMVQKKMDSLFNTNKSYLEEKARQIALNDKIDALLADNERIESTFDDVIEYQRQYSSLKAEYDSLKAEYDDVSSQLKKAEEANTEALKKLSALKKNTVTLSPGIYIAGVNIPSGDYLVTGDGSLLISSSANHLKVNTKLDGNTPSECELDDGDIIKLSHSTRFTPEED